MNLKTTIAVLLLTSILFSCSKQSTTTGGGTSGTSLQITVDDGGSPIPGATVYLFSSQASWDNYVFNGIPNYIGTASTNSDGIATFSNVSSVPYYWAAYNGCENSVNDSTETSGVPVTGSVNTANASLEQTGKIIINNTNKSFAITVKVNGNSIGSISAQHSITYPYASLQSYSISAYDPIDLSTQNASPFILGCGSSESINFNP